MITVSVSPTRLVVDRKATLVFRLSNHGQTPCSSIGCRFDLPVSMLRLKGTTHVPIIDCLMPGDFKDHPLDVRPTKAGAFFVEVTNLAWRDWRSATQRSKPVHLTLEVADVPFIAELRQAQDHERAGRWRAAWPLYWRAGQRDRAIFCHERSVAALKAKRHFGEAARECRDWAELEVKRLGSRATCDSVLAGWFLQAQELYALANDDSNAELCQDWYDRVMQAPVLEYALELPAGAAFTAGASTVVTIRVTNVGYGPARDLTLSLAGDLVQEDTTKFALINPRETIEWCDARIVPKYACDCIVSVEAAFVTLCAKETQHKSVRFKITAGQADLLDRLRDAGATAVQIHIEKYAAAGASINQTTVQDSVVIRSSVGNRGAEQVSRRAAEGSETMPCPHCLALVAPARYCTSCGKELGLR